MTFNIYLYNNLTREKELFVPIDEKNIRMYVCGPTLYDDIHIGNARPLIIFDLLYRLLILRYGFEEVKYVRNITDIDDKIITRAIKDYPNLPVKEATEKVIFYNKLNFEQICRLLHCSKVTVEPMVSEHLDDIRAMIEKLVKEDYAYIAENNILFDIQKYADYGKLSKRTPDEMLAGARVEIATYKRNPGDFILWKPAKEGEPGWQSPCGITALGRPGWHIECSAMSMAHLSVPYGGGLDSANLYNSFDIHGGGIDLMFPHHENEIAQTCCSLNTNKMANYWLHNGYLQVEGNKMSKSEGNFIKVKDIATNQFYGASLRLAMLQTHYRKNFNWTRELFKNAIKECEKWCNVTKPYYQSFMDPALIPEIFEALADDLNTPQAITIMREYYKNKKYDKLAVAMYYTIALPPDVPNSNIVNDILSLVTERYSAINAKNWQQADKLRDCLKVYGCEVRDYIDENGNRAMKLRLL